MKIVFTKKDMVNSLNIVSKALPDAAQSDILNYIIIDAEKNNIYLTASNQEITIKTQVKGIVEEEGFVAIEGKTLIPIIGKMSSDDEKIELKANDKYEVKLKYKEGIQTPHGKSPETFPRSIKIKKENGIKISDFNLKKLFEKSIFCVNRDLREERKVLTGINFKINKNKLTIKAIDEEKIAILNYELHENYNDLETIIPASTVEKLIKILKGDVEKNVTIYISEKTVSFEIENTEIISNIIQGNFINTDKIINTEYTTKIKINKNVLYNSVDRTRTYMNEEVKKPVIIDVKDNKMNVRISTMKGEANENLDIEKTGNDIQIAFNQNTFLSILNAIDENNISLYMTTSMHPIFIRDDKETYFYFMIPIVY